MGRRRGNLFFQEKEEVPPAPLQKKAAFSRPPPKGDGGRERILPRPSVPARPLRAGTGKPMRLSWGRAREGDFFLLKEVPLSPKTPSLVPPSP